MKLISSLVLAAALAGCAAPSDLSTMQRRAVSAIQTAQQASTQALIAGSITLDRDRQVQTQLADARRAVLAATTADQVRAAAATAGVQP